MCTSSHPCWVKVWVVQVPLTTPRVEPHCRELDTPLVCLPLSLWSTTVCITVSVAAQNLK